MAFVFSLIAAFVVVLIVSALGIMIPLWWPLPDPYLLLTCFLAFKEEKLFSSVIMVFTLGIVNDMIAHEPLGLHALLYGLVFLLIIMVTPKNRSGTKPKHYVEYVNILIISFLFHIVSKWLIFFLFDQDKTFIISYFLHPLIFAIENFLLAFFFWPVLEWNKQLFSLSH